MTTPIKDTCGRYELWLGDCVDVMPNIPNESIDAIVTDPPFFMSVANTKVRTPGFDKLKAHAWQASFEWIAIAATKLKNGGTAYIFTNDDDISFLRLAMIDAGLRIYNRLHWIKTNPLPSYTKRIYRSGIELAYFACKGGTPSFFRPRTQQQLLSYWFHPIVGGAKRTAHPTQKPLELIREWVENSCPPGGTVLDPFMGSSTTGVACLETGRRFLGIEIDPAYFNIAQKRMTDTAKQGMLRMVQDS